jgi:hypothetical protein
MLVGADAREMKSMGQSSSSEEGRLGSQAIHVQVATNAKQLAADTDNVRATAKHKSPEMSNEP